MSFASLDYISCHKFGSVYAEEATPVPIPNTEVKLLKVDGSVAVRLCESR